MCLTNDKTDVSCNQNMIRINELLLDFMELWKPRKSSSSSSSSDSL
jgi:hypothetical protein